MGCASSNPLATGSKEFIENAKESASEYAHKGELVIEDIVDTTKDEFTTGAGHVKEAMSSALETAENSIGSIAGKVSHTFTGTKEEVKGAVDDLEHSTEHTLHKAHDNMVEAVSEAETVLASEAEHAEEMFSHTVHDTHETLSKKTDDAKEALSHTSDMAFEKLDTVKDKVHEDVKNIKEDVKDALEIEDMEESLNKLEHELTETERKSEEIVKRLSTPAPSPPPEVEAKKQEPPTFWEARADAILEQRMKSVDIIDVPASKHDAVSVDLVHPEHDLELEDLELDVERPRAEDHLGEPCLNSDDKHSMKSFVLSDK